MHSLTKYLESPTIATTSVQYGHGNRTTSPVCFGRALKLANGTARELHHPACWLAAGRDAPPGMRTRWNERRKQMIWKTSKFRRNSSSSLLIDDQPGWGLKEEGAECSTWVLTMDGWYGSETLVPTVARCHVPRGHRQMLLFKTRERRVCKGEPVSLVIGQFRPRSLHFITYFLLGIFPFIPDRRFSARLCIS